VYQFVCDRNALQDAGKEDYLCPSEHIGLDWIGDRKDNSGLLERALEITKVYFCVTRTGVVTVEL